MPPPRSVLLPVTRPLRNPEMVMNLSSSLADRLRESAARADHVLPDDAKTRLLAEFERRGSRPRSRMGLLIESVRWPVGAAAAAAAAVLVVGFTLGGATASDPGLEASRLTTARAPGAPDRGVTDRGVTDRGVTARGAAGERALAWESFHPLPSSSPRVRVVDDQNLPLLGVGWTPGLDGP